MSGERRRSARVAGLLAIVCAVPGLLFGCASSSEQSCAYVVVYGGQAYHYVDATDVQVGEELGTGTLPGCDDGQLVPSAPLQDPVARVVGLDPADAIAVVRASGPADLLVRSSQDGDLPEAVDEYLAAHPPTDE